jgi:hypothetical protein
LLRCADGRSGLFDLTESTGLGFLYFSWTVRVLLWAMRYWVLCNACLFDCKDGGGLCSLRLCRFDRRGIKSLPGECHLLSVKCLDY